MNRLFSRKQRLMMLGLAMTFGALLPACTTTTNGTKPPGGGGRPGGGGGGGSTSTGSCSGSQQFQLTGAGSMDDPCAFDPIVLQNSHCKLIRLDVAATGANQVPPEVIFEKDGSPFERSTNVPTPGTWSATTTHFGCQNPPCADGTYAVKLRQLENPILCSEFGSASLTLVMR